jgi:nicotinamide mononucleotide transporter
MSWLNDLLWTEVGVVAGFPITLVELVGFVTGAWCVWLVGRQNPWSWPIGLIQVIAYAFLFWQAGLFADSLLQVVYIVLGLWGWWNWVRHRPGAAVLEVRRTGSREWVAIAVAGLVGYLVVWWWLVEFTSSTVPVADAATTVLSLLATYGQARKLLESWWLWIAADLIYIPLYLSKGLALTAVLYGVFLVLCVIGLYRWRASVVTVPRERVNA